MSRKVRVAAVALRRNHGSRVEDNRAMVMALLDEACFERPDIVCLPETFATQGVKGDLSALAEPAPGPTTDEAAKRAREHRTYVVCPLLRRDGERLFNSAVVLDRDGQIAGIYDKMHHPNISWRAFREGLPPEFDATLGRPDAPVFDLDFGKVGVQICFDIDFPLGWRQLAEKGAELVFWPSAFDGGFLLRAAACLHYYYIASSVLGDHAYLINPLGEVIERSGCRCPWIARTIDLDYIVCHFDWHKDRIRQMKEKYGDGVTCRVLDEEGHFLVECGRDDRTVADLAGEFRLMPIREFHCWHAEAYRAFRERQ